MKNVLRIFTLFFLLGCTGCASTLFSISKYIEHSRADLENKSVVVDTHTIHYLEGGSGETILMIHGFGADKDNWTRFSRFITDKYHVIAIDLPGFGDSSRIPEESYSIEAQIKRVHQFARKTGLKKYHIVGNSMGGCIAGVYSAEYPSEIRSVGLFAPAGVMSPVENNLVRELKKGRNPLLISSYEDYDHLLELCFEKQPYIPGSVKKYLADIAIRNRDFNRKVFDEFATDFVLEKKMKEISAKTLVLWGDKDKILDVSGADVVAGGIKNSEKIIMKDCGHTPMIERPEETAGYYLKFLESLNKGN